MNADRALIEAWADRTVDAIGPDPWEEFMSYPLDERGTALRTAGEQYVQAMRAMGERFAAALESEVRARMPATSRYERRVLKRKLASVAKVPRKFESAARERLRLAHVDETATKIDAADTLFVDLIGDALKDD